MNSIIRRLSSRSIGAQKNGVRRVREGLSQRLRQALAAGARSWLRRSGSLSRFSHAPGHLHGLWREERKAGLSVGQHQIHVAVCHADWRLVSCYDDHRCGAADASRLAHRQGARQALHARAARACRASDAERHRRRRNIDRKATRLPDRRQRSGTKACDLVRRGRPRRTGHGHVLCIFRQGKRR